MFLSKTYHVFKDFTNSVARNPWLYCSMIFIAFVGVVTANRFDVLSQEGGVDLLSSEEKAGFLRDIMEDRTTEKICRELWFNIQGCFTFIHDSVHLDQIDCSENGLLCQSSNYATLMCNLVDLKLEVLPKKVLSSCSEILGKALRGTH